MKNQRSVRAIIARSVATAVITAPVILAGSAAADLIIDDFSDTEQPGQWPVVMTSAGTTTITETGLTGVIGGSRTSTIFADSIDESGLDDVSVTVAAVLGKLDFASTVGAQGSISLFYDGALFDLSGESQIEIEFLLFDYSGAQDMPVTITLADAQEDSISLTKSLTTPGTQTLVFALGDFARGTNGVDLSSIMSIDIYLDGALATDFRVNEIRTTTIPAPAALTLVGMGIVTIGRRRRR